ncbi:MAG: glycerol-3-phosphate acyltransferase, partial [Lachnospiraceae bacterium]|nr:glycerol-3-phosphate acyltransferase [Lachnospiraceae bacterium]
MERIICIVIGYIFGIFQTGYIYGKIHHVDIREYGSGNAGTTNAIRVLGKKAGIITYLGDCLKAVFASVLIYLIFRNESSDYLFLLKIYGGLGVVLGHNFPFYMGFKGGKGIAASSGVLLGLWDFKLSVLALITFAVVTIIFKYVSLGSLVMMAGFLIEFIIFNELK